MHTFSGSATLIRSCRLATCPKRGGPKRGSHIEERQPIFMNTTFLGSGQGAPSSESAFSHWLAVAEPGSIAQYHDGFLTLDVAKTGTRLSAGGHKELVAVARLAWWASEERIVHLVQRRLGPNRFAYLAIMRPRGCGRRGGRPGALCPRGARP